MPCGRAFDVRCRKHQAANYRNGHPLQLAVTSYQLKTYEDQVRNALATQDGLWEPLRAAYRAMVASAQEQVKAIETRRCGDLRVLRAMRDIVRVDGSVDDKAAVVRLMAMGVMWHQDPGMFRSDNAFRHQVALTFLKLSPDTKIRWRDRATGKTTTSVLQFVPSRALRLMGQVLIEGMVVYGLKLSEKIEEKRKKDEAVRTTASNALVEFEP